jgi:hypothetical protein
MNRFTIRCLASNSRTPAGAVPMSSLAVDCGRPYGLLIIGNGHAPGTATGVGAGPVAAAGMLRACAARDFFRAFLFPDARRGGLPRPALPFFFPALFFAFAISSSSH